LEETVIAELKLQGVPVISTTEDVDSLSDASVMIAQGTNVKAVQRHLGHASAKTTLDTYAHLFPDSDDVTRRALETGLVGVLDDALASRCVTGVLETPPASADQAI
jgi:hypothetical protein